MTIWDHLAVEEAPDERWKTKAECLGEGTEAAQKIAADGGFTSVLDAMFPERGRSSQPAKNICALCPVADQCLEYALLDPQMQGVWGGTSHRQRVKILAERNPKPKDEPAKCGTSRGYAAHRRAGEAPCDLCKKAEANRTRLSYARRKKKAGRAEGEPNG